MPTVMEFLNVYQDMTDAQVRSAIVVKNNYTLVE